MNSPMANAILWNAIGRDNKLMEILLEKATEYEQQEIYYKFKNMSERPCNFSLEEFCKGQEDTKLEETEEYKAKLKNIMRRFNEGYFGV